MLKFALLNNLWCCYCQHRSRSLILLHSSFAASMPLSSWSLTKLRRQRTRRCCMTGNGFMISYYMGSFIVHSVSIFKRSNKNKYSCVLIHMKLWLVWAPPYNFLWAASMNNINASSVTTSGAGLLFAGTHLHGRMGPRGSELQSCCQLRL